MERKNKYSIIRVPWTRHFTCKTYHVVQQQCSSLLADWFPGLKSSSPLDLSSFLYHIPLHPFWQWHAALPYLDEHSLHEPMYYFQAMLAGTDLGMMLTTMPIVLGVLLLDRREIAQSACFTESYFMHTLAIVESGILPARAYDGFIDIRSPLRYSSIITISWVMKIGLWVLVSDFVSSTSNSATLFVPIPPSPCSFSCLLPPPRCHETRLCWYYI